MTPPLRNFLSAAEFPWKVVRFAETLRTKGIPPLHLQLYPTNRCNSNCYYCSCSREDRQVELELGEVRRILRHFMVLGARAVTISGGGEPTMHQDLRAIIKEARLIHMHVGLTSNGLKMMSASELELEDKELTWCRVSIVPDISPREAQGLLESICTRLPSVDIGLSMVVDERTDMMVAEFIAGYAEHSDITHVRFVQEIFNVPSEPMEELEKRCSRLTGKGVYQRRAEFRPGHEECFMARLKPVVAATGLVYPCCGVQYAHGDDRFMHKAFSMGDWSTYGADSRFNGLGCRRCYYWQYNTVLGRIVEPMAHERFL